MAAACGVPVRRDERVEALGSGWHIRARRGFVPCPWAFEFARFCPARPGDRVLDLGTGDGILLLALEQVYPDLGPRLGVERLWASAERAARNLRLARSVSQASRGTPGAPAGVALADVRARPFPPRAFDLVVSNPPFYPPGWGRQSADSATAGATHALAGGIEDFAAAAAHALSPSGRVVVLYDAGRLPALLLALAAVGLMPRALRFLVDDRGAPSRVLALAGRDGGGVEIDTRPVTAQGGSEASRSEGSSRC